MTLNQGARKEDNGEISVVARYCTPFQTGRGTSPVSYTKGTRCEAGGGVTFTTHTHLTLKLKKE